MTDVPANVLRKRRSVDLVIPAVKVAMIAFAAAFLWFYLTRLTTVRQMGPETWMFEANGYCWTFFWSPQLRLRWSLGLAAIALFLIAKMRVSIPWPVPATPLIIIAYVLAATLAIKSIHGLYFSWTFCFVTGAVLGYSYHWVASRLTSRFAHNRVWLKRFCTHYSASLLTACCLAFLAISIYAIHGGYPVLVDEQSQIAQARLILSGKVRMPVSEEFLQYAVLPSFIPASPTASQFPPGHILAMIPFLAAGLDVNWLNVICGAISVFFTVKLCRRMAGEERIYPAMAAYFAGILLICSPQFTVIQSSGMNHGSTMMMLVMAAWAFHECLQFNRWHLLWIGIFGLAWAAITRPYTAVPHGIVWGVVLCLHFVAARHRGLSSRTRLRPALKKWLPCIAAGIVPMMILAYYNYLTTGNALLFGYQKAQLHPVQFGFVSAGTETYSPAQALHNSVSDLMSLSRNMFGWLLPSWVLIFGWLVFTRFTQMEVILVGIIVLQFIFYRLYFWYEQILGTRYLSELMPFFSILGGLGLARFIQAFHPRWRPTFITVVTLFCICAAFYSISYWGQRLLSYKAKHQMAADYMHSLPSITQPMVLLIPYEFNDVSADYAFRDVPVWCVYQENEAAARQTPEFRHCRWVRLFEKQ